MHREKLHNLFTDTFTPRPIAWISTISKEGVTNIAPYSSLGIGSIARIVMFCIATRRDGRRKDTLINIEQTGEFCINIVTRDWAWVMNQTAEALPRSVSEFNRFGLTAVDGETIATPRLMESPINVECRLRTIQTYTENGIYNNIVIGKAINFIQKEDKVYPVGRGSGYNQYIDTKDGSLFNLTRPKSGL